jgi:hypothetical protein
LKQGIEEMSAVRFATLFFEFFVAAEFDAGAPLGFGPGQTRAFEIGGTIFDVRAKLFVHLVLAFRAMKKRRSDGSD